VCFLAATAVSLEVKDGREEMQGGLDSELAALADCSCFSQGVLQNLEKLRTKWAVQPWAESTFGQ
jgi:hypothetical protein